MKSNEFNCAKCGNKESFAVVVKAWAVMSFDSDGDLDGTDVTDDSCPDNDQEWDDESAMQCTECGHNDLVKEFRIARQKALADRRSPLRDFNVSVCRTGHGSNDIRVRARNAAQAEMLALDEAGDLYYSEHSSDYAVDSVQEVGK